MWKRIGFPEAVFYAERFGMEETMDMMYKSTRGGAAVTASQAILKGLSEDGGLFVPERIPVLDKTPAQLGQMSYAEVAY